MPRISLWFYLVGLIYVLIGASFGSYMGAAQDFTAAPAHAHLNLVGWVAFSIYGTFYALAPDRAGKLLTRIHFAIATLGVVLMIPALAILLYGDQSILPLLATSEIITIIGLLCFGANIVAKMRAG